MKKLFTLILISVATLSLSCKKEKETIITPKDFLGSWEKRSSVGGMLVPVTPPDFSPGNGNILKFTETNYERLSKGQPAIKGTYKLIREEFEQSGNMKYRIIYDGDTGDIKEFVEIVDGKLKVYHGTIAADGTESLYQKLQETN